MARKRREDPAPECAPWAWGEAPFPKQVLGNLDALGQLNVGTYLERFNAQLKN